MRGYNGKKIKIKKKGAFSRLYEGELQLAGMQIMNTASKLSFIQKRRDLSSSTSFEGKSVRVYYNQKSGCVS